MQVSVTKKNDRVDCQGLPAEKWLTPEELSQLRGYVGRRGIIHLECRNVPGRGCYVLLSIGGGKLSQAATAMTPVGAEPWCVSSVQAACSQAVCRMREFIEKEVEIA